MLRITHGISNEMPPRAAMIWMAATLKPKMVMMTMVKGA